MRRRRTLDGVKGLLLREAKVQPICLVFDDFHWIDTETQALLDSMVESLPGARVLLLVNYRPEYEHGWANKSYYTRLRLDPLSSEGAEELLAAILGVDAALDPLKKLLIERTHGNLFYLEESVQTLIESGALAGGPGAYKLTEDVSKIQVPSTVQAILAARIDRLPPEDKRLLQTASVIGTHVPYPLLSAIAEMSQEELQRGLSALQASEFLYETNLFPEREFTFKHALTHEVTYGGLVQERKRALHAAIVGAIENLAGYQIDEQVERLAHHAYEGKVWGKAATYLRQAGTRAAKRSAHQDAIAQLTKALETLENLPETTERARQELDTQLILGPAVQSLKGLEGPVSIRSTFAPANYAIRWGRPTSFSPQHGGYVFAVKTEASFKSQRAFRRKCLPWLKGSLTRNFSCKPIMPPGPPNFSVESYLRFGTTRSKASPSTAAASLAPIPFFPMVVMTLEYAP
jgi:predicted ATPase